MNQPRATEPEVKVDPTKQLRHVLLQRGLSGVVDAAQACMHLGLTGDAYVSALAMLAHDVVAAAFQQSTSWDKLPVHAPHDKRPPAELKIAVEEFLRDDSAGGGRPQFQVGDPTAGASVGTGGAGGISNGGG